MTKPRFWRYRVRPTDGPDRVGVHLAWSRAALLLTLAEFHPGCRVVSLALEDEWTEDQSPAVVS